MSRTYRYDSPRRWPAEDQGFRCRNCRMFVIPPPSGGRHRNHCPFCLYSRHVDGDHPGDRASCCGGLMAPVGAFARPKGEQVLVHRCLTCGFERHNRIAADDDYDLVLGLPVVPPRGKQPTPRRNVDAEDTA